ncbi:hypothetical protein B7494_g424 [Chlorociboria aeruginascens]|nr:hypothetical protein B7494_g424 [Chlorociboria aeruginascens]
MPATIITTAPEIDSFTALADHQSQTPSTFYNATPILHHHVVGARALTPQSKVDADLLPVFAKPANGTTGSAAHANGDGDIETEGEEEVMAVEIVDIFVTSENLILFNPTLSKGVSIPYPSISLHAIQTLPDPAQPSEKLQGLYMQLELLDSYSVTDDDDSAVLELTLIPPTLPITTTDANSSELAATSTPIPATARPISAIQALFVAVSTCSNLHPDPLFEDSEDDEDRIVFEGNVGYTGISGLPGVYSGWEGDLPPPFPGGGGWITAENVGEYFDEEGNWIKEGLGEGAGHVRRRSEVGDDEDDEDDGEEDEAVEGVNGHGNGHVHDKDGELEHKRLRTKTD